MILLLMRMISTMVAAVLLQAATTLAGPSGFAIWHGKDLAASHERLATAIENHLAIDRLADFDSHYALLVLRDADGEAEYHETSSDFYVVIEGHATLVVGGEIVDGRKTGPGELRGPSISEGVAHELGPGDMVNIPPRTAHQVMVEDGKTFTYFILKVNE